MVNCRCNASLVINGDNQAKLSIAEQDAIKVCLSSKDRGPVGKDATINGVNALEITASGNVVLTQIGSIANITTETFVFEQGVSSSEWEIQHNLNKYPAVAVVDSAGNEMIAEVIYNDLNNITVRTGSPFKGKAFLN